MSTTTKKRKKSSTQLVNPLSDARKGRKTNKVNGDNARENESRSNNSISLKVQNLWHRKSKAGYSLFIKYYGEQPHGIVVSSSDPKHIVSVSESKTSSNQRNGLSRASKRRKRKKKQNTKNKDDDSDQQDSKKDTDQSNNNSGLENITLEQKNHPLYQTFSSSFIMNKNDDSDTNYSHLLPFISALSKPLPLTFRVRTHPSSQSELNNLLQKDLLSQSHLVRSVGFSDSNNNSSSLIYQSLHGISKKDVNKIAHDEQYTSSSSVSLKSFLETYSGNGGIARQEIGSMLPVIALVLSGAFLNEDRNDDKNDDKKKKNTPSLRVLDMCASPGSKTLQCVEQMIYHSSNPSQKKKRSKKKHKFGFGRIVANDVHPMRLTQLQDAVTRSGFFQHFNEYYNKSSEMAGDEESEPFTIEDIITFTNHDASKFPTPKSGRLFDIIISDVPCSGDGTIRKDPHILKVWNPNTGNELHKIQTKILMRALKLIRVGGMICFSTCTFNPIENEAVVSAALHAVTNSKNNDANELQFEIVEFPFKDTLKNITLQNGVYNWRVCEYNISSKDYDDDSGDDEDDMLGNLQWYESYDHYLTIMEQENGNNLDSDSSSILKSMFPNEKFNRDIHLERTKRLFPQDQNTGGFFVALIKRIS